MSLGVPTRMFVQRRVSLTSEGGLAKMTVMPRLRKLRSTSMWLIVGSALLVLATTSLF